jgi:hypothetical protein
VPQQALDLDASLRADLGASTPACWSPPRPPTSRRAAAAERIGQRLDALVGRQAGGYDRRPRASCPAPPRSSPGAPALPDAARCCSSAGRGDARRPLPAAKLEPFVADVQAQRGLPPLTRADLQGHRWRRTGRAADAGRAGQALDRAAALQVPTGRFPRRNCGRRWRRCPGARGAGPARAEPDLRRYLRQARWQALLGALAWWCCSPGTCARCAGWPAVLLPLAASVVLVLAGLGAAGAAGRAAPDRAAAGGGGRLQLRAVLRPVAERGSPDEDTLASLMLANLTTVVSFALLATAKVPALSAVGLTVAPGALLALLLSAAFAHGLRGAWALWYNSCASMSWLAVRHARAPTVNAVLPAGVSRWRAAAAGPRRVHAGRGRPAGVPGALALGDRRGGLNHALSPAPGSGRAPRRWGRTCPRLPAAAVARREVALTIDDGPDPEVTPAGARPAGCRRRSAPPSSASPNARNATRSWCARSCARPQRAEPQPRASAQLLLLGPRGFAAKSQAAQELCWRRTRPASVRPAFARPAGLRNPFLAPVLHRLGLTLASWTRRGFDTRERDPQGVLQRLVRGLAAGDILLLHDGNAARDRGGRPVILRCCRRCWRGCADQGCVPVTLPEALPEHMSRTLSTDTAWRRLLESASAPYRQRRPLRLALRARQAGARPGVPPHARDRLIGASMGASSTSAAARACSPACCGRLRRCRPGASGRRGWPATPARSHSPASN